MPGSLQILVSSFFVFVNLGCVIFFTMVPVCKARQARLLKNVNKRFCHFVGQNQQKTKRKWDEKLIFNAFWTAFIKFWLGHNLLQNSTNFCEKNCKTNSTCFLVRVRHCTTTCTVQEHSANIFCNVLFVLSLQTFDRPSANFW